jgi:hypothetical protein
MQRKFEVYPTNSTSQLNASSGRVVPPLHKSSQATTNKNVREVLPQWLQKGSIMIDMDSRTIFAVDPTSSKQNEFPSSSGAPLLLKPSLMCTSSL